MKSIPNAADWRAMVYSHRGPELGNGVRVLLLYLADHMRDNRHVSVPRSRIARALNISPGEVTKRIRAARGAGLLDVIVPARPKVTAVYQGIFPDAVEVTPGSPLPEEFRGTGNPTSETAFRGYPGVSPISNHKITEPCGSESPRGDEKTHQGKDGVAVQPPGPGTPAAARHHDSDSNLEVESEDRTPDSGRQPVDTAPTRKVVIENGVECCAGCGTATEAIRIFGACLCEEAA